MPPIFVHLGRLSNRLDNKRKKRGCPPLLLYVLLYVEFLRHTNSFRSSQNDNSPLDTRFKRRSLPAKGKKKKERMSQSQTPGNHGGLENIEIKTLPPGSKMIRVGAFFCEERGGEAGRHSAEARLKVKRITYMLSICGRELCCSRPKVARFAAEGSATRGRESITWYRLGDSRCGL